MASRTRDESSDEPSFPVRLSLQQPILPTEYVQAKLHNLNLAATLFADVVVPPQRLLSFWRVVGRPCRSRGFQAGRSLLGGRLRADYGGGLCQLSGLLYYVSLVGGLDIIERHAHTRDIYDEKTRYAPLGADAAVAFGFKDLRVLNTTTAPIRFRFSISQEVIRCDLCSPLMIELHVVEFGRTGHVNDVVHVETRRRRPGENKSEVLGVSCYAPLQDNKAAPQRRP